MHASKRRAFADKTSPTDEALASGLVNTTFPYFTTAAMAGSLAGSFGNPMAPQVLPPGASPGVASQGGASSKKPLMPPGTYALGLKTFGSREGVQSRAQQNMDFFPARCPI